MTIIAESPHSPSTTPPPADRTPRWTDARDQMIHACALQEHIIANAPFLPAHITVAERHALARGHRFTARELDVDAMLHAGHSPVAYQVFLGGELKETLQPPVPGKPRRVLRELLGSMFGCSFRVWVLADANLSHCLDEFARAGHNGDPLDWAEAERAEYAQFVAEYTAAHPGEVS